MTGWDEIYRSVSLDEIPWHSKRPPNTLINALRKIKKGNVLDICSGAGTNAIYMAKKGFKVKGIDISRTAIAIAKGRAKEAGVDVEFEVGDALSLDAESEYDFVFDRGCFHHMEDKHGFIQRIYDSLKTDGMYQLMAFSERNHFDKSLTKDDLKRHFGRCFSIGKVREVVHREPSGYKVYLYTAMFRKRGNGLVCG